MHDFELIENSILSALEPLRHQGVRTIEVYAGQLDGSDEFAKLIAQFPAILIGAGDLQIQPQNRTDLVSCDIDLIVADRHLRGPAAATRGDASSPGIYALLESIRGLLNDRNVIPGWSRPIWVAEGRLHVDHKQAICLFAAKYQIHRPRGRD